MKIASKLKKIIFEFGIIGGMTGFIAVMPGVGTTILLTTMYSYSPWLRNNQEIGIVIFISIMTIFCGLALLAINFLGIVSGFAFGFQIGLPVYLTGILGAATVMFFLSKRYASNSLSAAIENKPRLKIIQNALINESKWRTFLVLILIRLSPAFPFAATNFLVSASGMSFKIFVLATIIGMMPRMLAVVFVGSSISELSSNNSEETWLLIVGIMATILAIFLISIISRRALQKLTSKHTNFSVDTISNPSPPND